MQRKAFPLGATLVLALLAALVASCSKTYEQAYEIPCGDGKLVLTFRVITHPPGADNSKLWLDFEEHDHRRNVDVIKPRNQIYARPTPSERYFSLRPGPDDWPIYVNPRDFTPAEFDLIRNRLQETLPELDATLANEPLGEWLDYGKPAKLSSVRYVDYESFRRLYTGPRKDVMIDVLPDGQVCVRHPGGMILVGFIVDQGHKVILNEHSAAMGNTNIPNLLDYVLSGRDVQGRTLASDFAVERVSENAFFAAMKVERTDRQKP